jgi:DNA-binding transcriptional ArsR family regulator
MIPSELDLLPEDIHWKDEGCELFPSCLGCPMPRCIEEEPRGKQRLRMQSRAEAMAALRDSGRTVGEIAAACNVSIRTVQRALAKLKKNGSGNDSI